MVPAPLLSAAIILLLVEVEALPGAEVGLEVDGGLPEHLEDVGDGGAGVDVVGPAVGAELEGGDAERPPVGLGGVAGRDGVGSGLVDLGGDVGFRAGQRAGRLALKME